MSTRYKNFYDYVLCAYPFYIKAVKIAYSSVFASRIRGNVLQVVNLTRHLLIKMMLAD
jgi:hypothetical protein